VFVWNLNVSLESLCYLCYMYIKFYHVLVVHDLFMFYPKYCIVVSVKGSVDWDCEGLTLSRLNVIKKFLRE